MEETEEFKDTIKLMLVAYNELMYEFPSLIIGGSIAILAHGYKLPRIPNDLDLIVPFDNDEEILGRALSKVYSECEILRSSMSDFNLAFKHTGTKVSVDLGCFPGYIFEDKILQNRGIRVSPLKVILENKLKYANQFAVRGVSVSTPSKHLQSAQKHWDDLKFLQAQGLDFLTDDKFGPRPEKKSLTFFRTSNTRFSAPW